MTEDLAAEFRRFATEDCTGRVASPSPLYEQFSLEIADDPELLELAAAARDEQPATMLLLASVQYLLFKNPDHRLAAFYPSVDGEKKPISDDTYMEFKSFCEEHKPAIWELLSARRVQTNTVRRSGCLLPAFEYVSQAVDRAPLGLVEIGASGGLNLCWDRYGYSYSGWVDSDDVQINTEDAQIGLENASVDIECELRGDIEPPLPADLPPVGSRQGIDLHPLDVTDAEDALWLDALIWPEHETRRTNVRQAARIVADNPPTIHEGDVLEELRSVVESVPVDQPVCLYNTYVLYQLSDAQRADLYDLVAELGAERDIYWLSCEWAMDMAMPAIHCYRYEDGIHSGELLARFHGHGEWLEWLQRQ